MTVLIAGDVQVVVSASVERLPKPGDNAIVQDPAVYVSGVGANVACDLRSLGVAVDVAAAVGDDPYGDVIRRELTQRGIGTERLALSPLPTSVFLLLTDATHERTMIGFRGANESLIMAPAAVRRPISWLHISGYMLLNDGLRAGFRDLVEEANRQAIPCSVDLEGIAQAGLQVNLRGVTVVLCNRDEYRAYFRTDSVGQQDGIDVLVVKSGVLGSYLAEAGRETDTLIRVMPTAVVDLTGAGDAFNAGLIAARLAGATWPEACRRGNVLAARKVAQRGPHL